MKTYAGYYINLDRSSDRRLALEAQIAQAGLSDNYQRFTAVDGSTIDAKNPGVIGNFLSHLHTLEQAVEAHLPIHIMEDDVILSRDFASNIPGLLKATAQCDIIFTSTFVPLNPDILRLYKNTYEQREQGNFVLLNAKELYFASMASCFYSEAGARKIIALAQAHVAEGIQIPIDIFLRHHIRNGNLQAAILMPFLTSITNSHETTIPGRYHSDHGLMFWELLTHSFYIDRDLGALSQRAASMASAWGAKPDDEHAQLLAKMGEIYYSGAQVDV